VEGLGDALRSLLLDPSFAGRLGRAAAARAKTDFDPDAMVAGLAEVYDDLGRRGSRGG
jgi:glycosyltransferase involved in cell wall biosynthesis